jgi:hypothetical protein
VLRQCFEFGLSHASPETWLYACGVAGGYRYHRHPDRPVAAGRANGARGGPSKRNAVIISNRSAWALQSFLSATGTFPPGEKQTCKNCETVGWSLLILPYMEQPNIYNQVDFTKDIRNKENRTAVSTIIPNYLCPTTSLLESTRTETGQLGDLFPNGQWTAGVGEEMGCIDYGGLTGPWHSVANPYTGQFYPLNCGRAL